MREQPRRRVGVVSMMRDYTVSKTVRKCFSALGARLSIYKYNDPRLYDIIKDPAAPSHWFFTGNGPDFVTDEGSPAIDERIYTIKNKMMFFVCYSHQLIAKVAGCAIWQAPALFKDECTLNWLVADPIFADVDADEKFAIYHRQYVTPDCKPPGWKILALCKYKGVEYIAFMKRGRTMYASQVHPEFLESTYKVLENWLAVAAASR
jgi:GMP synthase-like glutamine amidotransferase